MEIAEDSSCSVSTRKDEEERYLAYVNAFKQFSGKYPIIYYASYRDSVMTVSYTHLDVYKRQAQFPGRCI